MVGEGVVLSLLPPLDVWSEPSISRARLAAAAPEYAQLAAKQTVKLAKAYQALADIQALATGWSHGREGIHLLRIQDICLEALKENS